jgi:hypothetical protein
MTYAECAKRLRFRADSGDMGRKPDPDCDLRIAADLLDRARVALEAIASCDVNVAGDVVSIARAVLGEE